MMRHFFLVVISGICSFGLLGPLNILQAEPVELFVSDDSGNGVSDIGIYCPLPLIFDSDSNSLVMNESARASHYTDAKGLCDIDLRWAPRLLTDNSLKQMGYLYPGLEDSHKKYHVQLAPPSAINAILDCSKAPVSNLKVRIDYFLKKESGGGTCWPFITAEYVFDQNKKMIPISIPCPSGCSSYSLNVETDRKGTFFERYVIEQGKPEGSFNLGVLEIQVVDGYQFLGAKAPSLDVADWFNGKPVTLDELRGKVVLLYFWGKWCPPCRKGIPELSAMQAYYKKEGLVIIGVHDSSETSQSLRQLNDPTFSSLPFRIAIDKQNPEYPMGESIGHGITTDLYGINGFPGYVLISQEGLVHHIGREDVEAEICYLLYGTRKISRVPVAGQMNKSIAPLVSPWHVVWIGGAIVLAAIWLALRFSKQARCHPRSS